MARVRVLFVALFVLLLPRLARAETYPGEPFNGMQITYKVSGIALGQPTDKPGFGTYRTYASGKLVGPTVAFSGSVVNTWNDDGPNPSTTSFVTVKVSAGNVSESSSFALLGTKKKEFELEVRVPPGAKTASFSVSIAGSYGNGEARSLGVNGEAKTNAEIESGCPKVSAKTAQEKLGDVFARYYKQIPKGLTSSGAWNNIKSVGDAKYKEFACGGYQDKVLKFLDAIRFDEDPCVAALLDDWDYGPIQAWWGGHQAVVIYPRGKGWLDEGLVLDPWMTQKPAVYKIADWGRVWSPASAGSFNGIGPSDVYDKSGYPTHGGSYSNPKYGGKFTVAEKAVMASLPPDKRKQFDKMTLDGQHEWLRKELERRRTTTVIAHCPIEMTVVDAKASRKHGLSDGQPSIQLPDVRYFRAKLADGTFFTQASWPAEKDYTVSFKATGKGRVDVFVAGDDGAHFGFDVDEGDSHTWKKGKIQGVKADEELDVPSSKPALEIPLDWQGKKPSESALSLPGLGPMVRVLAVLGVGLVLLVSLVAFTTRRRAR